ncbi:MAG: hypothetical protein AB8B48_05190 [Pseudomonadales bacterium]
MLKKNVKRLQNLFHDFVYQEFEEVVFRKALAAESFKVKNSEVRAVEGDARQIDDFLASDSYLKRYRSRATNYLQNNFRVTMAMLNNKPIGFVWWTDSQAEAPECVHPHVERFGIELGEKEVYGFDLQILPQNQGDNVAGDFFHLYKMQLLSMGYQTVWGCAEKDNLPAMWLHRMQRHEVVRTITSQKILGRFLRSDLNGGAWYLKNSATDQHHIDFRRISHVANTESAATN